MCIHAKLGELSSITTKKVPWHIIDMPSWPEADFSTHWMWLLLAKNTGWYKNIYKDMPHLSAGQVDEPKIISLFESLPIPEHQ